MLLSGEIGLFLPHATQDPLTFVKVAIKLYVAIETCQTI